MTLASLAWRSHRHYARSHAAVALGIAAAVAVLAGSFLVGASVRDSLASITSRRLGNTSVVIGSETLFPESLADRLGAVPVPGSVPAPQGLTPADAGTAQAPAQASSASKGSVPAGQGQTSASSASKGSVPAGQGQTPLLTLRGIIRNDRAGQRAANVQIYGIDDRFFAFHGVPGPAPGEGDLMLSPDLVDELMPGGDDTLVVRVARPTDIPLDSLHARRDDTGRTMRLRYLGELDAESMGEFSLAPEQGLVRAAFVRLSQLQRDLDQPGRVNTILVASRDAEASDQNADAASPFDVRTALASAITADDLGLTFEPHLAAEAIVVESRAGLIPDRLAAAVTSAAAAQSFAATPVLSWLATRLETDGRVAPYSLVTAVGPDAGGDEAIARMLDAPPRPAAGGTADEPRPLVLNDWAARDLKAAIGQSIVLEYYRWADEGRLVTERATFRVAGIVPMTGLAADRRLAPDYPGITDSANVADWDPPFPIDLKLVRPIDEEYWDRFRATPKAFIRLDDGQALWQTRYGRVTSIRVHPRQSGWELPSADALAQAVARGVDPLGAGFGVVDVRQQNLAASAGATDFGAYFSYFSFFLVVSAVILAALFFRLSIEQRLGEVGLLRAQGFPLATVRRLFLLEGGFVALGGIALGLVLAVGWAALMMYGLRTWWIGAVGTTDLELHVDPASLAIGATLGALASLASIWITIRGLSRHSPRALLTGGVLAGEQRPSSRAGWIAAISLPGAVALAAAGFANAVPAVAAFFGAGSLALIGGLAAFRRWLGRSSGSTIAGHGRRGIARFGLRNAAWRPGRSLTSAALVAAAVFLLVSVDAFRKGPDAATGTASGTGGFALLGEAALPFVHDPRTAEGLEALGVSYSATDPDLAGVRLLAARLRPGEDASCLNLYQPKRPRVVGVSEEFVEAGRFRFNRSLASTDADRENPWRLLGPADADGIVPVIVDATSLQYVLHAAVGDVITIDVESDRPVRLRVVASLADSMLQGELMIAESAFLALYPDQPGYRLLFVDVAGTSADRLSAVTTTIEERMEPYGLDVENSARRLESYHRVENTYLSTFQTLGGLGLVLGSFGLIAVVLRNVLERRRELALLGAAGYTGADLQWLVLVEHLALVSAGLAIGVVAAMLAIAPVFLSRSGGLPALPLFWIGVVGVSGIVASVLATRSVRRMALVPSLRSE